MHACINNICCKSIYYPDIFLHDFLQWQRAYFMQNAIVRHKRGWIYILKYYTLSLSNAEQTTPLMNLYYCFVYNYNHQLTVKCIYSFALPEMKSSEKV